jgi:hypothetical protein
MIEDINVEWLCTKRIRTSLKTKPTVKIIQIVSARCKHHNLYDTILSRFYTGDTGLNGVLIVIRGQSIVDFFPDMLHFE